MSSLVAEARLALGVVRGQQAQDQHDPAHRSTDQTKSHATAQTAPQGDALFAR
ncbi:hypothetical protein DFAR_3190016 [Desulfarculales bacterium]